MTGGGGQHVTTSLAAVAAFMQCGELIEYAGLPAAPVGGRDYQGPSPLRRYYRTADGWIRLSLTSLEQAGALLNSGVPPAADLQDEIASAVSGLTNAEVLKRLSGGVAAPARTLQDLAEDPAMLAARYLEKSVRPGRQDPPPRLTSTPCSAVRRPPAGSSRPASGNTRARSCRRSVVIPTSWSARASWWKADR